ncbi:MAG: XdhC family protein [Myxococcota bacterium]
MNLDAVSVLQNVAPGRVWVTVCKTWGSNPRPVGSHMVVDLAGTFEGSVSSGCIEPMIVPIARAATEPEFRVFNVSSDAARAQGLACGGRLELYFEPISSAKAQVAHEAANAVRYRRSAVRVVTRSGSVLWTDGPIPADLSAPVRAAAAEVRAHGGLLFDVDAHWLVQGYAPAPRLVIIGGTHIAQVLAPMAQLAGWWVQVVDPRDGFSDPSRFPGVSITQAAALEFVTQRPRDAHSAVVTLTHQPVIDDPILHHAVQSECTYVGALGSRRTAALRVERMINAGLSRDQVARIHGPVGLNLGGRSPAEIAVSIVADLTRCRRGRDRPIALGERPPREDQ